MTQQSVLAAEEAAHLASLTEPIRKMTDSPALNRVFGSRDQQQFAEWTGDFNPMHMDPIASRRTLAGAPVVHGVHAALWAVDVLIGVGRVAAPIATLKVQFHKFIYVDAGVILSVVRQTESLVVANLTVDGLKTATIVIGLGVSSGDEAALLSDQEVRVPRTPLESDLLDLGNCSGLVTNTAGKPATRLFRHATSLLGSGPVQAIAALSTVVGMICPGLHSIFSSFNVKFVRQADRLRGLSFKVRSVDKRFRMMEIDVAGDGISGTATAFVRQPPVKQRTMRELLGVVSPTEFQATTALIVGGSRGLGALTARIIAAGGGRVVITYLVGEAEARDLAEEIGPDACRVLRYDALDDAAVQLQELGWDVNQLYYFATTHIFRQKTELYIPGRFAEFSRIYVDGFQAVCAALRGRGSRQLSVFYPSSIAVEDRPQGMTEYSMAKAAGEMLCTDMNRFVPGMRVIFSRLPRMLTDQTATVVPIDNSDPVEVMLPIVREMHAAPEADALSSALA